jgi:hypothetical protein
MSTCGRTNVTIYEHMWTYKRDDIWAHVDVQTWRYMSTCGRTNDLLAEQVTSRHWTSQAPSNPALTGDTRLWFQACKTTFRRLLTREAGTQVYWLDSLSFDQSVETNLPFYVRHNCVATTLQSVWTYIRTAVLMVWSILRKETEKESIVLFQKLSLI